jgi:hypothetical protein
MAGHFRSGRSVEEHLGDVRHRLAQGPVDRRGRALDLPGIGAALRQLDAPVPVDWSGTRAALPSVSR